MLRLALLTLAAALCLAQPELQWGPRTDNLRIGVHADLARNTLTIAVENNSADQLDFAFDPAPTAQPARVIVHLAAIGPDGKQTPLHLTKPRNARTSVDAHDTLRWDFPLSDFAPLPALLKAGHTLYAVAILDETEQAASPR